MPFSVIYGSSGSVPFRVHFSGLRLIRLRILDLTQRCCGQIERRDFCFVFSHEERVGWGVDVASRSGRSDVTAGHACENHTRRAEI